MAERTSGDMNDQISEIAECPICSDTIKNNRLLPCGHTFCLKCLEQYKKTSKAKGKSLPCPICRKEFTIPKGGCAMFPKNIIVEKLLEAGKEESNAKQCDTCDTEHRTNAIVHCIECEQSLCSECEKMHKRLKASAAHHVVPVSINSHFHTTRRNYCEHHPEYVLELMCYDCDKTICWKCKSLSHANHRADDMQDLADGYCEQLQLNSEEIDARLFVLSKIAININDQERQYQDNFEKEKENVSKTAASLIRSVVSNEEKLIRQLSTTLQRNLKTLQPHKQQVQGQMDSLKQYITSVKQLKESGNSLEIISGSAGLHNTAQRLLSASIVIITEPSLSTMTENEIKKHLIGTNVSTTAAANATSTSQTVAGSNSASKPLAPATLKKPELKPSLSLQSPTQDDMSTNATSESHRVLLTLQTAAGTNSKSGSSPPPTLRKPGRTGFPSLQSSTEDDVDMKAATFTETATSESPRVVITLQTSAGTNSKSGSSPPPTLRKPGRTGFPSLQSSTEDDVDMKAATFTETAGEPSPVIYINSSMIRPLPPPPQLPLCSSLPPAQSTCTSGRNTPIAKVAPEQQTSAKGMGLSSTKNIGSSADSFSVGDGSAVFGVAVFRQKVFVATEKGPDISVYSADDHCLLHTLVVPGLKQASDLAFCHRNSCLYLVDWKVRSIFRVDVEGGKEITHWSTEGEFGGLSTSGDATVILAGHETNSLKEYTTFGLIVRTVKLKSDVAESIRPWHAVKLASDQFIVSHGSSSDTALHRVCLVDSEGQVIKSFGGLKGRGNNSLSGPYHLCITDENKLFIADCNNRRVVVLNANLEFVGEIAGYNMRKVRRICLDKTSSKLFVTDNRLIAKKASDGRIVIFSQVS